MYLYLKSSCNIPFMKEQSTSSGDRELTSAGRLQQNI